MLAHKFIIDRSTYMYQCGHWITDFGAQQAFTRPFVTVIKGGPSRGADPCPDEILNSTSVYIRFAAHLREAIQPHRDSYVAARLS